MNLLEESQFPDPPLRTILWGQTGEWRLQLEAHEVCTFHVQKALPVTLQNTVYTPVSM